jgi:protein TonB
MAEVTARPAVGPEQRLVATTLLAIVALAVALLGITFVRDDPAPVLPTLDILITETTTPDAPDKADFLAQANNVGGGDSETPQRPRDDLSSLVPVPRPDLTPVPIRAQAPRPQAARAPPSVTTVAEAARRDPTRAERPEIDEAPLPLGDQLLQRNIEMARLAAEVARREAEYARRPKRKFVSASTREYAYAEYLRRWAQRVERVGNDNYPAEARRRGLSGRLVMTVAIRRDGGVESVVLNVPSRHSILDQAAQRIVRLAEPYPPLPDSEEPVDILHITRTWEFSDGSVSSR